MVLGYVSLLASNSCLM